MITKKIKIICVFLLLFCVSAPANATSIEDQINLLLQQISNLQAQLAQLQGGSGTWCHNFSVSMRVGDKNSEVGALVNALYKNGIIKNITSSPTDVVTYTNTIAAYVSAFQEKYSSEILTPSGLKKGTGFAGASTRAKLNKLFSCGLPASQITSQASIKVTTPSTDDIWISGGNYPTRWTSNGIDKVNIDLINKGSDSYKKSLVTNYPNTGAYTISLPVEDYSLVNNYAIRVSSASQTSILGDSGLFKILKKSNTAPIINGIYGTDALSTNQTGSWSINATDDSGQLQYAALWGDESSSTAPTSDKYLSSSSLSHAYTRTGTFTITFYVKDSDGNIVQRSTTVTVTGTNPAFTVTVASPNGGENWEVGKTQRIIWTYTGTGYVRIYVFNSSGTKTVYDGVISASNGYYDWVITNDKLPNGSDLPNFYKIRIDGYNNEYAGSQMVSRDDSNNYFTVSNPQTCVDSDGGLAYNTKGTVVNSSGPSTDYCFDGVTLYEYVCAAGNTKGYEIYTCVNGCLAGACK